ncbi:Lrp/AsnC family transcriptional regulator [Curtobacterium sp. MCBD17_003]|uniref:Lrp/AsnC family transcriptional regulator n=1 Tax=Curtobacterium sp. MCBD17_003 TaxID=2175667 RepID=UPI000DA8BC56|nr:Lrp/AsnC family transcriptional regulator [Curtobacterium sp. MCBD17_003]WIE53970.1 Lrp/AsnC family transcriptional regulator [Curtobacterium sp. MCBD17_003]
MSTSSTEATGPDDDEAPAGSKLAQLIQRPTAKVPLDDLDHALLRALADDSRRSQRALSREVALSAPAIGERIARLERLGVIRAYTLDIDWATLGYSMSVHIPMTAAAGADLGAIIERLVEMPELEDLDIVTGQWDLIAKFRLRDHAHLQEVLLVRIWQIPGVQRVETFLGLGNYRGAGVLRDE